MELYLAASNYVIYVEVISLRALRSELKRLGLEKGAEQLWGVLTQLKTSDEAAKKEARLTEAMLMDIERDLKNEDQLRPRLQVRIQTPGDGSVAMEASLKLGNHPRSLGTLALKDMSVFERDLRTGLQELMQDAHRALNHRFGGLLTRLHPRLEFFLDDEQIA